MGGRSGSGEVGRGWEREGRGGRREEEEGMVLRVDFRGSRGEFNVRAF